MLSISKPLTGEGAGLYYVELGREDYYLEGGEPPGKWAGRGAKKLGVSGQVGKEEFMCLFRGFSPRDLSKLTQNAGEEGRRSGWDLTFSAPKSVSALWSVADEETRRRIEDLQERATERAISYLEEAGISRRGKGGADKESCNLVFALFPHSSSRAQDPQLHTHGVLLNVGVRDDGTTGTLETREIFLRKMAAGAIYRAELSEGLERELHVRIERDKDSFLVDGVPKELTDFWSTRRKEIEEALKEKGFSGAKASAVAALDTRETKEVLPREELLERWKAAALEHGFTEEKVQELLSEAPKTRNKEEELSKAVDRSLEKVTLNESTFTEKKLVAALAVEAQGRGISGEEALKEARKVLREDDRIVLISDKKERLFSTKEMVELEERLVSRLSRLNETAGKKVSEEEVNRVLSERSLSLEQRKAVRHLTDEKHGVSVAAGLPGTGKSYALGTVREVYEREGYKVLGAALSGKAAMSLQEGSGIKSETIHKTLSQVKNGDLSFNRKTVLVVDEAAMVPTRLMDELTQKVALGNAKLILVGDKEQLQSIEAGGAFSGMEKRLGSAELTDVVRQREEWARKVVKDFHRGRADTGLKALLERDCLKITDGAKGALIKDWKEEGVKAPKDNLILAATNSDVTSLNKAAQMERRLQGVLGEKSVASNGYRFYEGDRVVINKNSRLLGVRNGDLGTVKEISGKSVRIELDRGRAARINLESFPHMSLGYAITTHKAQGATAEKAFVLGGGPMTDKHIALVQVSRARDATKVYIEKGDAAGLNQLAKQMSLSKKKEFAIAKLPNFGKIKLSF